VCAIATTALAVAMGIGRFAFTPLLPLMVRDGSLAPSGGAWLAASNYLGYLTGALTASRVRLSLPMLLRASLAGIAVATAAMGAFDGLGVWTILRFVAGVLSAYALVATSAWALQHLTRASSTDLSGILYAGVGLGIALTGLFCFTAAQPGVRAAQLWLELGVLGALAVACCSRFVGQPLTTSAVARSTSQPDVRFGPNTGVVVCYGAFGFGYILPATFLPALARDLVDDPQLFGLAWPVFGVAAALSTIATVRLFGRGNRLRVWAVAHLLMAAGVILPSIWLVPVTIAIAALMVGGTFMVVTMIGMQEAQARATGNPTALLGLMTAAFAIGQLAGPVVFGVLDLLPIGHRTALAYALQLSAFALASSAAYLWRHSYCSSSNRAPIEHAAQSTRQGGRRCTSIELLERLPTSTDHGRRRTACPDAMLLRLRRRMKETNVSSERKVAVITGASQGIGAALVEAYRGRGYRVVATSRSIRRSDDTDILAVPGDIADRRTAEGSIAGGVARFGRIDTLVNNAGVFIAKPFTQYSEADYATMLGVNLMGFFHMTQLAIAEMEKRGGGHIVQITTSLIDHANSQVPSVLASLTKGGLDAATRSLAIEYAKRGIRVNAVAPGVIKTPMHPVETHRALGDLHPLGRMGEIDDIVDAILYLESATFVTGETLHVDAGQSAGH
jgi:NAD(P)-dependent dehydrogenase (short-subunit alcohol dehydrogenase family)/MFS family permease